MGLCEGTTLITALQCVTDKMVDAANHGDIETVQQCWGEQERYLAEISGLLAEQTTPSRDLEAVLGKVLESNQDVVAFLRIQQQEISGELREVTTAGKICKTYLEVGGHSIPWIE